ncbi:asparaginase-domain-containing protein [Ilyonectria robusta]|uniref:asparaginase-domain-containing protein n=1 Tax=Ilyonectria robusta TaxID=1079257 RepID=UPI001E8E92DD|nr:asparaginase-domain-containing protein [Ilyonectria robusta]KAH8733340.1 asparaginase-domain-containing protein [Ilyonectria robusta]
MSDYQPPSPQANGNGSVYGSVQGSFNNGGFNSGGFSNSSILNGGFSNGGFNNGSVNNGSVVSPSVANRSRHGSRSSNSFGRIQTEAETKYPESRVLIIGTGGTICMQQTPDGLQPTSNFLENAMAPRPSFNDFSPKVTLPAYRNGQRIHIDSLRTPPTAYDRHVRYGILEFNPLLDSSSIEAHDWDAMAMAVHENYHLFDGFVILHGTDSLAYTASALSFMMNSLGKPVILTGSQAPIFSLQSDGVDNLLGSLIIAGTFVIPEVCLFFHHRLYRGNRSTKVSATNFEAFDSPNAEPLATVNGLGITVNWPLVQRPTTIAKFNISKGLDTTHVACLRVFPGIKPEMIDSVLHLPDLRGLILETFGMGNIPGGSDGQLTRVIKAAVARGIVVVNVSQCVNGFVSPVYGPGTLLGRAGVIFGLDLTAEAALTKLSYLLALPGLTPKDISDQLSRSLRGEMTEIAHQSFSHPAGSLDFAAAHLTRDEMAFSALGYAIENGELTLVKELLQGEGSHMLKQSDYAGNTAVHLAAVAGSTEILLELLHRGASVHERNKANNSALFVAVKSGKEPCAQLLRLAGAHLSVEERECLPGGRESPM